MYKTRYQCLRQLSYRDVIVSLSYQLPSHVFGAPITVRTLAQVHFFTVYWRTHRNFQKSDLTCNLLTWWWTGFCMLPQWLEQPVKRVKGFFWFSKPIQSCFIFPALQYNEPLNADYTQFRFYDHCCARVSPLKVRRNRGSNSLPSECQ